MTEAQTTTRQAHARALVRRNVWWSAGVGLLPFAIIDFVALTALQVRMIKQLSGLYGVPFQEQRARTLVWSLVTGLGSVVVTGTLAYGLFKVVPLAGLLLGVLGGAAVAGALTQAIGNLFIVHFEAGGTLLTFDVEAMRAHFHREFEQARSAARSAPRDPIPP